MSQSDHPYREKNFYIRWSELDAKRVLKDIPAALVEAYLHIDQISMTDRGKMSYQAVLGKLESATSELFEVWGKVDHLDAVHNSPELREAMNELLPDITDFSSNLYLNASLWDLIKTYSETEEAQNLSGIEKRHLEETLRDFIDHGAELKGEARDQLRDLQSKLAKLTQKFSENVLDSSNDWELYIDDPQRLEGLPESALAAARQSARQAKPKQKKESWRFTLQAPSMIPALEYLHDDELRKTIWQASSQIGSTGEWDNTELIWEILDLRQQKAQLLGKDNFAELVLERRMAKEPQQALGFIEGLHKKIKKTFDRECVQLQEYKAEKTGLPREALEPWETAYWAELRRKDLYDFDTEQLRPYFPMEGVLAGLFEIAETIFKIKLKKRQTIFSPDAESQVALEPGDSGAVEVWHPDVLFYDLFNEDNIHLGSFYADWHPREDKRSGAWMNYLKTGQPPSEENDRSPHLGLICGNLSPSTEDTPALLTHNEVETVFHEFGHLLHHLLGEVPVAGLNGVNVAWDFVELPSQIMENFCWEKKSLDLFAKHYQSGETIPDKLFKKMLAARNYLTASSTMRQLSLARLDLLFHSKYAQSSGENLDELSQEILLDYQSPLKTQPPTIARRFSHLFSGPVGYAAGYYSYKWAEVLDADAFTRFQKEGILNPVVGMDFRNEVLSKGNSQDPDVLFHNFLGRDPNPAALLRRSGLAT